MSHCTAAAVVHPLLHRVPFSNTRTSVCESQNVMPIVKCILVHKMFTALRWLGPTLHLEAEASKVDRASFV